MEQAYEVQPQIQEQPQERSFTFEPKVLAGLVRAASAAVSRKTVMPALSTLLVECFDDYTDYPGWRPPHVRFSGTDLDTQITVDSTDGLPCFMAPAVSACPNAAALLAAILAAPKGSQVTLTVAPTSVTVTAGPSRTILPVIPVADFPKFRHLGERDSFLGLAVDRSELQPALRASLLAAGTDDARPILTGIYTRWDGPPEGDAPAGEIEFVATDSYRLSRVSLHQRYPSSIPAGAAIMGAPMAQAVVKMAAEPVITLRRGDLVLSATDGDRGATDSPATWITGRVIDGDYPDYTRLLPDPSSAEYALTVDARAMLAALTEAHRAKWDLVHVTVDEFAHELSLKFTRQGAASVDVGAATTSITLDSAIRTSAEPVTAAFSVRFLADGMRHALLSEPGTKEPVPTTLYLWSPLKPMIIQPARRPTGWSYLLMPVRTGSR